MFEGCNSLTNLDVSGWNTAKVTNMHWMFLNCVNLTTIYASSSFVVEQVTDSEGMFSGCPRLIGGNGTVRSGEHNDKEYARIDKEGTPGYFTQKYGVFVIKNITKNPL